MTKQEELVRQDYVAAHGAVTESYPGFIRMQTTGGGLAGFKMTGSVQFQPGARIAVVALRDSDEAVFVINRDTGEKHRVHARRGNFKSGFRGVSTAASVVLFVLLLIPIVGQLTALAGGLGAILGGVVGSGFLKGYPRVDVGRILLSLAVYFVGTVIFLSGLFGGGGSAPLGFLILLVGAYGLAFWSKQSGQQYMKALEQFIDQSAKAPAGA